MEPYLTFTLRWALLPQFVDCEWFWGQQSRGLVLLGSFLIALGVAVFAWGSSLGFALLGLAAALVPHPAPPAGAPIPPDTLGTIGWWRG